MKYFLAFVLLFGAGEALLAEDGYPDGKYVEVEKEMEVFDDYKENRVLKTNSKMRISVVAQGVAPAFTSSPAQAYAMAKRAAMVEAYRMIGERVNGVEVEGQDTIKNMVVQRSTVRANVKAMIRNAVLVESTFKDGMCEVEMEIILSHNQFE